MSAAISYFPPPWTLCRATDGYTLDARLLDSERSSADMVRMIIKRDPLCSDTSVLQNGLSVFSTGEVNPSPLSNGAHNDSHILQLTSSRLYVPIMKTLGMISKHTPLRHA
jgi:hypothetical protein